MAKLRRDAGYAVLIDPGADKPILETKTLQCKHCGGHFVPRPGSGIVRGFCMNCNGPICGPGCAECVPTEVLLENYEKGRPENYRPIVSKPLDNPTGNIWTP